MHGLSEQDLEIRRRAREFIDTLIPYEVEAELAGGVLPAELTEKLHQRGARQRPLRDQHAHVGGRSGLHARSSRCWCRSRSAGSPTAWRGACTRRRSGGSRWRPRSSSSAGCGRRSPVSGTSATRSPRSSPAPTSATWPRTRRRRDGDDYVVNGTKWHVTSYNLADYCFVQAVLTDGTERRRARAPRRRPADARASRWSARRRTPTTSPTTTRSCRSPTCASRPRS